MQAAHSAGRFTARNDREILEVTVCGDSLIHVTARATARPAGSPPSTAPQPHAVQPNEAQPWLLPRSESCPRAAFQFSEANGVATLTTARVAVSLSESNGNLVFKSAQGGVVFPGRPNQPRTYLPSTAFGLYHIEDRFAPDSTEALYGLGQHQSGMFNYRGSTVEFGQNNTDIAIPLLVPSKGYSILWNTASFSYVENRFPLELNLESMAAPQIDYYVLYGPQMDNIVHEYRSKSGHVPLFPEWA